jgi:uncharacterized protein (TIGR02466 family)
MIIPLISSHLFVKSNIGTFEQRTQLLQEAYQNKTNTPKLKDSNDGCWRSDFKYKNIDWLIQEFEESFSTAMNFYLKDSPAFKSKIESYENFPPVIYNYWTNINSPKSRNELHAHKKNSFVGLYYIQAKDTGALIFKNPANLINDCAQLSPYVNTFEYLPNDGDLILWPAWVPHEVAYNTSNQDRVNIAFNITLSESMYA